MITECVSSAKGTLWELVEKFKHTLRVSHWECV